MTVGVGGEPAPRPTVDLVRSATDRRLVERLLAHGRLTRAELAEAAGVSKPTASEAVRRLELAGVLEESGRQVGKRGPAGRFFRLHDGLGTALSASAGPEGVLVESHAVDGTLLTRVEREVPAGVDVDALSRVLTEAVGQARAARPGPVLATALSVAGPVEVGTGRPVALPYAPFPLDGFRPSEVLATATGGPVEVDNDVNWVALAEREAGAAQGLGSFLLCYLGAGVGGALVVGGGLVRGARGLAGELAYVATADATGRSRSLIDCLSAPDLLIPGSVALDVDAVRALLSRTDAGSVARVDAMAAALAGALGSACALLDPEAVLVGGPWGASGDFVERVAVRLATGAASSPPVRRTALTDDPALTGAGLAAVDRARSALLARL